MAAGADSIRPAGMVGRETGTACGAYPCASYLMARSTRAPTLKSVRNCRLRQDYAWQEESQHESQDQEKYEMSVLHSLDIPPYSAGFGCSRQVFVELLSAVVGLLGPSALRGPTYSRSGV